MDEIKQFISVITQFFVRTTRGEAKLWQAFFIPFVLIIGIAIFYNNIMFKGEPEAFFGSVEHVAFRYAILPMMFWWWFAVWRCSKNTTRAVWTWSARLYVAFGVFRTFAFIYHTAIKPMLR